METILSKDTSEINEFLNAINSIPLPKVFFSFAKRKKPINEPNKLQPQDVFEIMNELLLRYLNQSDEANLSTFALSALASDCDFDQTKLSKIAWHLNEALTKYAQNNKLFKLVRSFLISVNSESIKDFIKFYVHAIHLLAYHILPNRAEPRPITVELGKKFELIKFTEISPKEIFKPEYIFPNIEQTEITSEFIKLLKNHKDDDISLYFLSKNN